MSAGRHIVLAGAGNTGSHLAPHLARMAEVGRLTLVDPDTYASANLAVQDIEAGDIGQPKATALRARLLRIQPDLEVIAREERIEDVPRGLLCCDLFVSCLDSRRARQHVNEIAWRLNRPWLDCGVLGSQELARVSGYVPATTAPCLECSWSTGPGGDYELLEQEYACSSRVPSGFPSMATSGLGSLAASLLAMEIQRWLRDGGPLALASRQLVFDARHSKTHLTQLRRNPWCRFDHRSWIIEPWPRNPEAITVADALTGLGSVCVEGHHFVTEVVCPACGHRDAAPRLNRPLARCEFCHRRMAPAGFGSMARLDLNSGGAFLHRTLAEIGVRTGDILSGAGKHVLLAEAV